MAQMVRNSPAIHAGDLSLIPGLGRSPGGGCGNPLQYSCLENPQGQRSLAGYSPWDHKESDRTVPLNTAQHELSSVLSSPLFTREPSSTKSLAGRKALNCYCLSEFVHI